MNRILAHFPLPGSGITALIWMLALSQSETAEVYSPVFGFLKYDCPANSDTVVSVPFHSSPRWAGRLSDAPSNQGGNVMRLSLKDSPSFATGELTDTPHLFLCRDQAGPTGRYFDIVAHGANTVDISALPADLGALTTDGLISIVPAWTLDRLFPADTQTTFHASGGPLASDRVSELLFFDDLTPGTSLAPTRRFYVTDAAWFEVGSFGEAGSTVVLPGQAFIVRHPSGVAMTEFVANQQVFGEVVSLPVRVANGKARDTMLALPRPVTVTLDQLDLGPGVFEESSSTDPGDRKDQLLVFDNASVLQNKGPSATYFRSGGQWLRDGTNAQSGSQSIEPSAGLLIRKAAGGSDQVLQWANAPTYDVTAP